MHHAASQGRDDVLQKLLRLGCSHSPADKVCGWWGAGLTETGALAPGAPRDDQLPHALPADAGAGGCGHGQQRAGTPAAVAAC